MRSTTSPVGALAAITLDGQLVANVNTSGPEGVVTSYTSGQLDGAAPHTIVLRMDTSSAAATWSCIGLDSFVITVRSAFEDSADKLRQTQLPRRSLLSLRARRRLLRYPASAMSPSALSRSPALAYYSSSSRSRSSFGAHDGGGRLVRRDRPARDRGPRRSARSATNDRVPSRRRPTSRRRCGRGRSSSSRHQRRRVACLRPTRPRR